MFVKTRIATPVVHYRRYTDGFVNGLQKKGGSAAHDKSTLWFVRLCFKLSVFCTILIIAWSGLSALFLFSLIFNNNMIQIFWVWKGPNVNWSCSSLLWQSAMKLNMLKACFPGTFNESHVTNNIKIHLEYSSCFYYDLYIIYTNCNKTMITWLPPHESWCLMVFL